MSPDSLTRDEALEDFAALRAIVRDAYGGYEYFASRGCDWNKLFDATTAELRGRREWEISAYFGVLMRFFKKAGVSDGHLSLSARATTFNLGGWPGLSVWWPRFSDYYVRKSGGKLFLVSRSTSSAPSVSGELLSVDGEPPQRFLFPTFAPDMTEETFLLGYFGDTIKESLTCRIAGQQDSIVLSLHAGRMFRFARPESVFEERRVDGVPVVSLRTFHDDHAAELERFVKTAEELRGEPVVVLDLRGNDGGSDGYGLRWLQRLSSATIRVPMRQVQRSSALARAGAVNQWEQILHETDEDRARAVLVTKLALAAKRLDAPEERSPGFPFVDIRGQAPENFAGRLIVLTDRRNGSAGESFLQMLKALPGTVVMGENSAGINTFGPVGLYQLPNSAIRLSLGTAINLWGGKILEGAGVTPDLWIDEPDALPSAVSFARLHHRRLQSTAPRRTMER